MLTNFLTRTFFNFRRSDSSIEAQWTRYYVEILVSSITKTFEVFTVALVLGVFPLSFATYISFSIIRTSALGWHAFKSRYCSFQSILFFSIIPYLFNGLEIKLSIKILLILFFIFVIYKYAPQKNSTRDYLSEIEKKILKKKSLIKASLLSLGLIYFSGNLALAIFLAIMIQIIMLVPITKKIVEGKK